ncbi:aminoacylase-1-like isoform X3 [Culicoides brevitarsis]|uniref:aminoacylase-1-like isoform X3 n=1 Tax=Culicoides brevitarsis TaxID=469753 RepID=UPI00307BB07F
MTDYENNEEIKIFREYLRIPTVHPNIDYEPCVTFLERLAAKIGLDFEVIRIFPKKPIVVMTWKGTNSDLPTIFLNSHTDVVPVFEEHWSHPPFAAEIDNEGKIYARGAQDMKCIGMQYLTAIKALKSSGFVPKRTVYVTFVPEEEIGGAGGMKDFVKSQYFEKMNVGVALDESAAYPGDAIMLFYAERPSWRMKFVINGSAGHGSLLIPNTVGEKIRKLLDRVDDYRNSQMTLLEKNPFLGYSDCTSINLTLMEGGLQSNVIPSQATLVFDSRLSINTDHEEFEEMLNRWCAEAGGDITIEYEIKEPYVAPTPVDDSNIFWKHLKEACDELNLNLLVMVCPAGTDARFIREKNIPAFGFSPMPNTPILLHDHDEYIKADVYLKGIEIYEKVIQKLANC